MLACINRCRDRSCRSNLRKGNSDHINSWKVTQEDVQELYTGEEMAASYVYAQAFTTILVTMMYSGGCPILYPITFLNFIVVYWTYKMLLISYFKKTTHFDENLAFDTVKLFNYSVLIHLFTSLMMFTNHDILSSSRIPQEYLADVY